MPEKVDKSHPGMWFVYSDNLYYHDPADGTWVSFDGVKMESATNRSVLEALVAPFRRALTAREEQFELFVGVDYTEEFEAWLASDAVRNQEFAYRSARAWAGTGLRNDFQLCDLIRNVTPTTLKIVGKSQEMDGTGIYYSVVQ